YGQCKQLRGQECPRHTIQTEKATLISERGLYLCRQLPTLPHTFACSTIGPAGLCTTDTLVCPHRTGWILLSNCGRNLFSPRVRRTKKVRATHTVARTGVSAPHNSNGKGHAHF